MIILTPIIADIFESLKKSRSDEKKVEILQNASHHNQQFKELCAFIVNPHIQWEIPEGTPPYRPGDGIDTEAVMWAEIRRLYIFVKGGADNMNKHKKEMLFIDILESLHPKDAKFLIKMKDKEVKGINEKVVNLAFPGMLTY